MNFDLVILRFLGSADIKGVCKHIGEIDSRTLRCSREHTQSNSNAKNIPKSHICYLGDIRKDLEHEMNERKKTLPFFFSTILLLFQEYKLLPLKSRTQHLLLQIVKRGIQTRLPK